MKSCELGGSMEMFYGLWFIVNEEEEGKVYGLWFVMNVEEERKGFMVCDLLRIWKSMERFYGLWFVVNVEEQWEDFMDCYLLCMWRKQRKVLWFVIHGTWHTVHEEQTLFMYRIWRVKCIRNNLKTSLLTLYKM